MTPNLSQRAAEIVNDFNGVTFSTPIEPLGWLEKRILAALRQTREEALKEGPLEMDWVMKRVRHGALEEAAKACMDLVNDKTSGSLWSRGCRRCALTIRALASGSEEGK